MLYNRPATQFEGGFLIRNYKYGGVTV